MCDGNYLYPNKGGAPTCIKACILICGNKRPEEMYPKVFKYIEARFNIIELDQFTKQVEWPPILRVDPPPVQEQQEESESALE
ncbi:MAG: hypothetical protein [Cressdnaviricota sp.]|nr:MAG: hypothetical protein [Cressdnaviricota sp.]